MVILQEKLKEISEKLIAKNGENPQFLDFSALRELRRFCDSYYYECENVLARVEIFLLLKCLDDVFVNLMIDTTYNENVLIARQTLYKNLKKNLPLLIEANEIQELESIINILGDILKTYIKQIKYINKNF